ncbi:hypothetical protein B0T19DRAFT_426880 [Cercophora scortea]|uniref:Ribosomal protein S21 n=1 Tax=Cercophora scortea TaxID=314031 RepID=A0AAE0IF45_9PEZI|nr:hypothetical protein B0T19DRAFT_426880 [Cercophora scortea]
MNSVCRSTAATATMRSSLLLTACQPARAHAAASMLRPATSSLLLQCPFSTTRRTLSDSKPAAAPASPANRPAMSSLDRLRQQLAASSAQLPPRPPLFKDGEPGTPSSSKKTNNPVDDILGLQSMINSDASGSLSDLMEWHPDQFRAKHQIDQTPKELRLRPSVGRTVHVTGHVDVGRSFFLVERMCKVNRVKRDVAMQRFHERNGLKRKRLKRERWAKRFSNGFHHTVCRVMELRKQGW